MPEPPDVERLRTALDPLRLGGAAAAAAVAQRMEAEDAEDIEDDEESETEEDLHLDMDEGEANAKSKVTLRCYQMFVRIKSSVI